MEKLSCDLNPALKPTGMQKFMTAFGMIAFMLLLGLTFVFATNTTTTGTEQTIIEGIQGGMKSVYRIMTTIMIPIAAVVLAWCAFKVLFGGEKGMQQAKTGMLTIVIVIALVWLAPMIITTVSSWFSSGNYEGDAFSQQYNAG